MMTQLDGYIRVSRRMGREGPGYISPGVQREAIERWAEFKGVEIAQWHVDEDETGGTQDRPGLNVAIERAVNGETAGIVSWRIDRFSRFTEGGLADLRRLEDHNARLVFVVEDIDTSGPMGRLVYTLMLAVGEYFLSVIKAGWITAKSKAVGRGVHIGPTPFGYTRKADGRLATDPVNGPVVTEAFAIAAREGLAATVEFLSTRAPQRTWRASTARRFLGTRTYLGRVGYGELVHEEAHEALVSRSVFEAAAHAIGEHVRSRAGAAVFPLSGIAACGTCGGKLVGARGGNDKRRMYRCSRRCGSPVALSAQPLEDHVVRVLRIAFEHPGFQVGEEDPRVDENVAAVEDAERELDAFASDLTARRLLGERYHRHLQDRVEAIGRAQAALQATLADARSTRVVVPDELWDDLTPRELRVVLGAMLDTVVVDRGRGPLAGRVRVVPKGLDVGAVTLPQDA